MLQAVQLESNSAPAKTRSGTDNGSDPALAVFAGMMAQASSARPADTEVKVREAPSEGRSTERAEAREASRPQEPTEARKTPDQAEEAKVAEKPSSEPAKDPKATGDTDPAPKPGKEKAADTQVKVTPGVEVATTPQAPASAQVTQATQATQAPQTGASLLATDLLVAVSAQGSQVPPETSATQRVDRGTEKPGTTPLPPLPKELQVTVDTSAEASSARPQSVLKELLHLPKVEIQTPKLNPEMAAKVQAGPVAASTQTLAGEPQDQAESKEMDGADLVPSGTPVKALAEAANHPAGFKLELAEAIPSQVTTVKAGSPDGAGLAMQGPARTAQAPTIVEATPVPRPNPVAAQVEGSIRWILNSKSQGAELQLHPESLGRVVIQLKVDGQEVHARLWASESSSVPLLQEHRTFLENSLKEQGLVLSSFDLQSGARGNSAQTAFQEQASAAPTTLPHLEIKQEMPTELQLDPADPYRVEVYA